MSDTQHPSHNTPVTIIQTVSSTAGSTSTDPHDGWWLYWSDAVANDWTERYTELSHALLRVAASSTAANTTTNASTPTAPTSSPPPQHNFWPPQPPTPATQARPWRPR